MTSIRNRWLCVCLCLLPTLAACSVAGLEANPVAGAPGKEQDGGGGQGSDAVAEAGGDAVGSTGAAAVDDPNSSAGEAGADQAGQPDGPDAGEAAAPSALSASEIAAFVGADGGSAEAGILYVNFAHLTTDAAGAPADPDIYRYGVTKALNSLSTKPAVVRLTALDPGKLIYKVRLADFALTTADWAAAKAVAGAATAVRTMGKATVVDGDWLVYAVTRPEVYDKILRIPNFVNGGNVASTDLETQLGIVDRSKSVFITVKNSDVTFDTRILERIPVSLGAMTDGYYWRSYDFLSSADPVSKARGLADPTTLHEAAASAGNLVAGEMFFSLPNGMQAFMLSGFQRQHRIDAQSVVATDYNRPQDGLTRCVGGVPKCGYVINGESCLACHAQGMRVPRVIENVKGATQDEAMALINQDMARYNKALKSMGFEAITVEPIKATLRRYRDGRQVSDARPQGSEVNPVINILRIFGR